MNTQNAWLQKLVNTIKLKGTNISMERYFRSISVANWALDEQSISTVETMRHDRKGILKELKNARRQEKSAINVYSESVV